MFLNIKSKRLFQSLINKITRQLIREIISIFRRTIEDVMEMIEENSEGKMEFPRDMIVEDCFSDVQEPLFGFVTNVTIPEDRLRSCVLNAECFENGTMINAIENIEETDWVSVKISHDRLPRSINRQGNTNINLNFILD